MGGAREKSFLVMLPFSTCLVGGPRRDALPSFYVSGGYARNGIEWIEGGQTPGFLHHAG